MAEKKPKAKDPFYWKKKAAEAAKSNTIEDDPAFKNPVPSMRFRAR